MATDSEVSTLAAFVGSARKRHRLVGVLSTKKRRTELDEALSHDTDLWDARWTIGLDPQEQTADAIEAALQRRGAPSTCHVLGGIHDGEVLELHDALHEIVGTLDACLVICAPGKLAYHESEDPGRRVILARP